MVSRKWPPITPGRVLHTSDKRKCKEASGKEKQVNEFNKQNMNAIHKDLDAALKAVGDKHGISLSTGTLSSRSTKFTCRVTGLCGGDSTSSDGSPDDKYAYEARSAHNQVIYGTHPDMIGKQTTYGGETITFVGLAPSKKKYPYVFRKERSGKLAAYPFEIGKFMLTQIAQEHKISVTKPVPPK